MLEATLYSYLGSIVTGGGGTDEDVTSRIKKANVAFVHLYRIWKNKNIRMKTKLNIFNSNMKVVLLYGCETWKVTNSITQKLQSFINRCLRRIVNVQWPDVISNIMLWEKTGEKPIGLQIKKRK
jgi:nucleosome binding factor SPN SPT16 subunit